MTAHSFSSASSVFRSSGTMMRSFLLAQNEFAELDGAHVLTGRISLSSDAYAKPEDRLHFYERLVPKLQALPGAQSATLVSNPPGTGAARWKFEVEGRCMKVKRTSVTLTPT